MFCSKFQKAVLRRLDRVIELLEQLAYEPVDNFIILGRFMDILPGQSTVLTAVPLGASGSPTKLPSADVPVWSVSDASQVDVSPSGDGLSLAVTVHKDAPVGDLVFNISDALIPAATGSFTLSVAAPAVEPVASFSITASTPT